MPQAAQAHREKQIDARARRSSSAAAQRNVNIVANPRRKRNVPSIPKISHTHRLKWRMEVGGEMEAQQ